MAKVSNHWPDDTTIADILHQLGDVAPSRIRIKPPPGRATEKDLIRLHDRSNRLYELVDGILVEKVMGALESFLALEIGRRLGNFLEEKDLGFLLGADGAMRIMPGLIRIPDVSFVAWSKVTEQQIPTEPVPDLVPDLAVEVLSEGNTRGEMERKLREYFLAGVRLIWFVDPARREVTVHSEPDRSHVVAESRTLDGSEVLPGFSLPLRDLFARIPHAKRPAKGRAPRKRGG